MSMFRKGIIFAISIITTMAIPLAQIPAMAMEGGTEAFGSVMLPTIKEEIISVDLPTVGDESPFDFYIDPQGLLYDTGAVRHGGGVVEEGAYLLFHNHDDGEYDFSGRSDRLKVTNRSTVPVNITITAKISDLGDLRMDQDGSFEDENDCAIYLAIVDDEGNERVLSEDGEVSVEVELSSAPSEAYTFRYDESTDTYEYVYQNYEDISFDSYSFGLRGECNANADWSGISASPRLMVTWSVDPVYPDDEGGFENYDLEEEEIEEIQEIEETEEDSSQSETETSEDESTITDTGQDESAMTDTEQAEDNTNLENNENDQPSGTDTNDDSNADTTGTSVENDAEPDVDNETEPEAGSEESSIENSDSNATDSGEITDKEEEQDEPHQEEATSGSDVEVTDGNAEETSGIGE